jgi:putative tryptophan/tyrosine transport system substrate-binding protein
MGVNVKRRTFFGIIGGAAAWPLAASAQPRKVWRIGFVSGNARPEVIEGSMMGGFPQGMRELGYIEGRDFVIEWRFAEARAERYDAIADELAKLNIDIFVVGAPQAVAPLRKAAPETPIVLGISTDPVGRGFAQSLSHPGGMITGLANSVDDTAPKQVELLASTVPNLSRLGVLGNPSGPNIASVMKNIQAAAKASGIGLVIADARTPEEFSGAFEHFKRERTQAFMVISDVLFNLHRRQLVDLSTANRLPSMFSVREYVEAGGLMSYGQSFHDFFRRSARYVDKLMKGAKAADLPIEQPSRFYLTINLKTANAIGIEVPTALLLRADEVIE